MLDPTFVPSPFAEVSAALPPPVPSAAPPASSLESSPESCGVASPPPPHSPGAAAAAVSPSPSDPTHLTDRIDPTEMRAGLTAEEVCLRVGLAARHEDTGRRALAFYLVEMEARRLYQGLGYGSTAHYAETKHGLDRRRVAELIRVGAQLLELRKLDQAFCEGQLGWPKVLIVARMATPEHEAAWLSRALALDVRDLTRLAARSKEGCAPRTPGDEKGLPEIRFPVSASVGPLVHAKLEQAQMRLGAELGRAVDIAGLLDALLDQFLSTEADGTVPGRKFVSASSYQVHLLDSPKRGSPLRVLTEDGAWPLDAGGVGLESAWSEAVRCDAGVRNHHVPGAQAHGCDDHDHRARDVETPSLMRGQVLRRDWRRCRSCRGQRRLMVHHIEFRSHGGRTLPGNLLSVCSLCHALVHAGLLRIEGESVATARFVDASGRAIEGPAAVAAIEQVAKIRLPLGLEAPTITASAASAASDTGAASDARASGAGPQAGPGGGVVALATMPAEVDGAWWNRHAHLVRERGEGGSLRFETGTPIEPPPPEPEVAADPAQAFSGLLGQDDRVARLRRVAEGRRAMGKPFPHVLFTGPAGTGKTSLARGIATLVGQSFFEIPAPMLTDRVSLVRMLAGLSEGCVLFLDEAHALPRPLQEMLLEALSEHRLSLLLGDGARVRRVALRLPRFTLLAATTDEGAIPPALRSRFGLRETLVHYGEEALAAVVSRAAAKAGRSATPGGARRLAAASRGTPREALRLLDRTLDEGAATGTACLDEACVERTLHHMGYDAGGLDPGERRYLEVLRQSAAPVPLSRLACILGTTPRALMEHVEPWLFLSRFVRMTPAGREATSWTRILPVEGFGGVGSVGGLEVVGAGESVGGLEVAGGGAPNVRRAAASAPRTP